MKSMKYCLATVALGLLFTGCATAPSQDESHSPRYGAYPANYQDIIKAHMSQVLKDPRDARYEFLNKPAQGWRTGSNKFGYVVCANINAKNDIGEYAGARQYYFLINGGRVIEGDVAGGFCSPYVR